MLGCMKHDDKNDLTDLKMVKTYSSDELTHLARTLTQREWDRLFPPRPSREYEPSDASGYTGDAQPYGEIK